MCRHGASLDPVGGFWRRDQFSDGKEFGQTFQPVLGAVPEDAVQRGTQRFHGLDVFLGQGFETGNKCTKVIAKG
jgi:hypothetical protein